MSSSKRSATTKIVHAFGVTDGRLKDDGGRLRLDRKINEGVQWINDSELVYPVGSHVALYSTETHDMTFLQQFTHGLEDTKALAEGRVTASRVSRDKQYLAVCTRVRTERTVNVFIFLLATRKLVATLPYVCDKDRGEVEFVDINFSSNNKFLIGITGNPETWKPSGSRGLTTITSWAWAKSKEPHSQQQLPKTHVCCNVSFNPWDHSQFALTGFAPLQLWQISDNNEMKWAGARKVQSDMNDLSSDRCVEHVWVNEHRVLSLLSGRNASTVVVWENGDQAQIVQIFDRENEATCLRPTENGFIVGSTRSGFTVFSFADRKQTWGTSHEQYPDAFPPPEEDEEPIVETTVKKGHHGKKEDVHTGKHSSAVKGRWSVAKKVAHSAHKASPPNSPGSPGGADKIFMMANKTIEDLSAPLYNRTPQLVVDAALLGLDPRSPLCICSMSASPVHIGQEPHTLYDGESLALSITNPRPVVGTIPFRWMMDNIDQLIEKAQTLKENGVKDRSSEDNFETSLFTPLPGSLGGYHTGVISGADMCVQRPLFVTCSSEDHYLHVWDMSTKECRLAHEFIEEPLCVAIHPVGNQIVVGLVTNKVKVYHLLAQDLQQQGEFPLKRCQMAKHSNGGHVFACASTSHISIIDSYTLEKVHTLIGHMSPCRSFAWSPFDCSLLSASREAQYRWDTTSKWARADESINKGGPGDGFSSVTCVRDGKTWYTASHEAKIKRHSKQTSAGGNDDTELELAGATENGRQVLKLVMDPQDRFLFTGCMDGSLRSYNTLDEEENFKLLIDDFTVQSLHSGACLTSPSSLITEKMNGCSHLMASRDGRYIVSCADDGSIFLLEVTLFDRGIAETHGNWRSRMYLDIDLVTIVDAAERSRNIEELEVRVEDLRKEMDAEHLREKQACDLKQANMEREQDLLIFDSRQELESKEIHHKATENRLKRELGEADEEYLHAVDELILEMEKKLDSEMNGIDQTVLKTEDDCLERERDISTVTKDHQTDINKQQSKHDKLYGQKRREVDKKYNDRSIQSEKYDRKMTEAEQRFSSLEKYEAEANRVQIEEKNQETLEAMKVDMITHNVESIALKRQSVALDKEIDTVEKVIKKLQADDEHLLTQYDKEVTKLQDVERKIQQRQAAVDTIRNDALKLQKHKAVLQFKKETMQMDQVPLKEKLLALEDDVQETENDLKTSGFRIRAIEKEAQDRENQKGEMRKTLETKTVASRKIEKQLMKILQALFDVVDERPMHRWALDVQNLFNKHLKGDMAKYLRPPDSKLDHEMSGQQQFLSDSLVTLKHSMKDMASMTNTSVQNNRVKNEAMIGELQGLYKENRKLRREQKDLQMRTASKGGGGGAGGGGNLSPIEATPSKAFLSHESSSGERSVDRTTAAMDSGSRPGSHESQRALSPLDSAAMLAGSRSPESFGGGSTAHIRSLEDSQPAVLPGLPRSVSKSTIGTSQSTASMRTMAHSKSMTSIQSSPGSHGTPVSAFLGSTTANSPVNMSSQSDLMSPAMSSSSPLMKVRPSPVSRRYQDVHPRPEDAVPLRKIYYNNPSVLGMVVETVGTPGSAGGAGGAFSAWGGDSAGGMSPLTPGLAGSPAASFASPQPGGNEPAGSKKGLSRSQSLGGLPRSKMGGVAGSALTMHSSGFLPKSSLSKGKRR